MKGHISIGQYRNYREEDGLSVFIQVEDEMSGTRFLEVHMTPEDFGKAVLGLGMVDCEFDLRAKNVGKIYEHKTEEVFVEDWYWKMTDDEKLAALAPHQIDGWSGYISDIGNHHRETRRDKNGAYYKVRFSRFVDAPVAEEA